MHQHAFLARRRVMNEPRFLELQPSFIGEVVEFIGRHGSIVIGKSDFVNCYGDGVWVGKR